MGPWLSTFLQKVEFFLKPFLMGVESSLAPPPHFPACFGDNDPQFYCLEKHCSLLFCCRVPEEQIQQRKTAHYF